ncbi:hypothetical protein LL06_09060 [Hoeflea sp. BAL378]|uniref:hypothetical protein n=1 Tax=Hoeflea sp. BAL378 TaxID=1547437 RepID=UPI000512A2DF|nr:hypothetical protein [Hoeflea sp. BAL378]KGF69756.1 hypothetical protein LL06_09060 [Hoeflea sp. BAL378]
MPTRTERDPDPTPDQASGHDTPPKQEKLERLDEMKFDLERQTARGTASLDQVEARAAALKQAIDRAKARP